jgi:hypothetical protein
MTTKRQPVLYFAHPVNVYDTELERALLACIAERFPEYRILNPNAPEHAAGYKAKGMQYFLEGILPQCDLCVLLAFPDRYIGKGVYAEAEQLHAGCNPVWEILPDGTFLTWAPNPARMLTVEATRARIRMPDGKTPRPYFSE